MKIHQNTLKSKTSFALTQNLYPIPNNDNKPDGQIHGLPLFDRTNRLCPLVLDYTNIIILSENPDQTLDLSIYIQTYYACNEKLVKLVTLREFCNLLIVDRNNPNFTYVVAGSTQDLSAVALAAILSQFTNIFVFQLPGLKLACSYSGYIKSTADSDNICAALGGDKLLRKHLLSTLNEHEFLAITGKNEVARVLKERKILSNVSKRVLNDKVEGKNDNYCPPKENLASFVRGGETTTANCTSALEGGNHSIFIGGSKTLGRVSKYDMELSNICVIGNEGEIFELVAHITIYFERQGYHLELVSPEQFLRAGRSANFSNQHYLIHIDPAHISGKRVGVITDHCNTTFISRASRGISVTNKIKYNRIIGSLGENYFKRKVMLDSLKQDEFLVINKDNEMILCLNDEDLENE